MHEPKSRWSLGSRPAHQLLALLIAVIAAISAIAQTGILLDQAVVAQTGAADRAATVATRQADASRATTSPGEVPTQGAAN